MTLHDQPQSPQIKRQFSLRRTLWVGAAIVLLLGVAFGISKMHNATVFVMNHISHTIFSTAQIGNTNHSIDEDPEYALPENDPNRLDILILGIRGKNDAADGGMLTDTILLFSLDTTKGKAVLTSIPRDLTVRITDDKTGKINEAYAHYGVGGTKKLFSRVLGIGIDNAVVVDFNAFESIVNTLGGITITLDKAFEEPQQWGYSFSLPAGKNNLTGEQALYYSRSRYSTSDFDRSRRQMQVIMAIKEKATALSLTRDPIKLLEVISALRSHVETDLNVWDLSTIKKLLAQQDSLGRIARYQLTTENVLYETKVDGIYELLPRDNSLSHIKRFMQTLLTDTPVLPTPMPADSSPQSTSLTATPASHIASSTP